VTKSVEWGQVPYSGRKRSWHIMREVWDFSVCGRAIDPVSIRQERPGNEKTCETCLRIVAPK
jgi:hypothetical protein